MKQFVIRINGGRTKVRPYKNRKQTPLQSA